MNVTIQLEKDITFGELYDFLHENYSNSNINVCEYAKKIINNAYVITVRDNNGCLLGISCVYYNDLKNEAGFLTLIWLNKRARGNGYGKELIKETCDLGRSLKFRKLLLEVNKNNKIAYNLYIKEGFILDEQKDNSYILCKILFD